MKKYSFNWGLLISMIALMTVSFLFGKWYSDSKYSSYVSSTEKLIDEVYQQYPNFLDIVGESDEYTYYIKALNKIK